MDLEIGSEIGVGSLRNKGLLENGVSGLPNGNGTYGKLI